MECAMRLGESRNIIPPKWDSTVPSEIHLLPGIESPLCHTDSRSMADSPTNDDHFQFEGSLAGVSH